MCDMLAEHPAATPHLTSLYLNVCERMHGAGCALVSKQHAAGHKLDLTAVGQAINGDAVQLPQLAQLRSLAALLHLDALSLNIALQRAFNPFHINTLSDSLACLSSLRYLLLDGDAGEQVADDCRAASARLH